MKGCGLLQTALRQFDSAVLIVTGADGDLTLGAEINAGGLRGGAVIVDDDAADAPGILHMVEETGDGTAADVIGDDVAVDGIDQSADQQVVVSADASEIQIRVIELGIGSAGDTVGSRQPLNAAGGRAVDCGISAEADPVVVGSVVGRT